LPKTFYKGRRARKEKKRKGGAFMHITEEFIKKL